MPIAEDNISLAEIVRTMKDFREEFRSTVSTLMRTDVYQAQQATLRAEITAMQTGLTTRISDLESKLETKIADLRVKYDGIDTEKRQKNMVLYGTFITAAVSVVLTLLNLK